MIRYKELRGERLIATDGAIGSLLDLYFDDVQWMIRYLVVDTRRWLPGRKVLIAPEAVLKDEVWERGVPVGLTCDQIKNSPGFDSELPVSRQNEQALLAHYQWAQRITRRIAPALAPGLPREPEGLHELDESEEPQLRSAREVLGYGVVGPEGPIGDLVDFRFDKEFVIQAIEVEPGLREGIPVLTIPPRHIESVSWSDRKVLVNRDFGGLVGPREPGFPFPA